MIPLKEKFGAGLLLVLWAVTLMHELLDNYFNGEELNFLWAVWKGVSFFIILWVLAWRDKFSYGLGLLYGVAAFLGSLAMFGLLAYFSFQLNSLIFFTEQRFIVSAITASVQLSVGFIAIIIYYPLFRNRLKS